MTRQPSVRIVAVLLVAAGLSLLPHALRGQGKPVPADDNKLIAELNEELSDVEAEDQLVDEDTVEEKIDADLRKSAQIDYDALETEMERDHTTIEDVILEALKHAEADAGEQLAAFAPAGGKKVNAKSVANYAVAGFKMHHDNVKPRSTLSMSGLIPDSEPSRP